MSRPGSTRNIRFLAAAFAGVLCLAGTLAHAQAVGPVTITGKLYIDGYEYKVNCKGDDGNSLDATPFGERIITIASSCPLYGDTGTADEFHFYGEEQGITGKNSFAFSGVEGGSGPVHGAMSGLLKLKGSEYKSDVGTITYSWNPGVSIIFIGKYKAKF